MKDSEVTVCGPEGPFESPASRVHKVVDAPGKPQQGRSAVLDRLAGRGNRCGSITGHLYAAGILCLIALVSLCFLVGGEISLGLNLHPDRSPVKEMISRQKRLQPILDSYALVDETGHALQAAEVLTYPVAFTINDTLGRPRNEYTFPTSASARLMGDDHLFVSLPTTLDKQRYLSRPCIQVRTFDRVIPMKSQVDLVEGLTMVVFEPAGDGVFYYVDVNSGHISTTIGVAGPRMPEKDVAAKVSANIDEAVAMFVSAVTASLSHARVTLDVTVARASVVLSPPDKWKLNTTPKDAFQQSFYRVQSFLNPSVDFVRAQGHAILGATEATVKLGTKELMRDLRKMRSILTRYPRKHAKKDTFFTSSKKEVQKSFARARRNAQGIHSRILSRWRNSRWRNSRSG